MAAGPLSANDRQRPTAVTDRHSLPARGILTSRLCKGPTLGIQATNVQLRVAKGVMMKQTIVAMYDRMEDAQNTVRALKDAGFNSADISLVAPDAKGEYSRQLGTKTTGKHDAAAGGATAGAVLGGLGGLLVGLGALAIPGIGPVIAAGPLATGVAALVGAGAGAVAGGAAGGILGALVDLGIPKEEAGYYAEGLRRGGVLVSLTTDDSHVSQARSIMDRFNAMNVDNRVAQWRQSGWKGYDVNSGPWTGENVVAEGMSRNTTTSGQQGGTRVYPYNK